MRDSFFKGQNYGINMVTCKLIARHLILKTGQKFEPGIRLGEDTLFMYHLLNEGIKMEYTESEGYLYRMHSESATHSWRSYHTNDPLAVYKRIRDEEYRRGNFALAEKWERNYLSSLRAKYHQAKRSGQKKVSQQLRLEAEKEFRSPLFAGSRLIWLLTFYSYPMYRIGAACWHGLRRLTEREAR